MIRTLIGTSVTLIAVMSTPSRMWPNAAALKACQSSEDMKEARFAIRKKEGLFHVHLEKTPAFVKAINTKDKDHLRAIKSGTWLVLAVSGYSPINEYFLPIAFDAVKKCRQDQCDVKYGIVAFANISEIANVYPDYDSVLTTPVWLVYRQGKVMGVWTGGFVGSDAATRTESATRWLKGILQKKK